MRHRVKELSFAHINDTYESVRGSRVSKLTGKNLETKNEEAVIKNNVACWLPRNCMFSYLCNLHRALTS